jgi:biopolymer transport protein ExbD
VSKGWVILDGNPVEELAKVAAQDQMLIPKLSEQLLQIRAFSENLGKLDPKMGFKGNVTIQGDREIPFGVLKKIMFTCGRVGFNNMLLAVNQEEKS